MTTIQHRRVAVTGLGAVSALGVGVRANWQAAAAGRSGIGPITRFSADGMTTTIAGEARAFDPADHLGSKQLRRLDRYAQFAMVSAREAVAMSGLEIAPIAERVGVMMATAVGGMESVEAAAEAMRAGGPRRVSPFFMPMMLGNMAAGNVAIDLGAKGLNYAPVSACAASAHAIGEGALAIRDGRADAMIVGGGEAPITPLTVAGFASMGALSRRNDDPAAASRPFDTERDGFVMAEGGAALVLEAYDQAAARGATILAEVIGYGATDDANHMVQPAPGGEGGARAMELALADAGLAPPEIDYVNAHGTSTPLNEAMETAAMVRVFGDAVGRVPVSSTKSVTGHLLGAAGAIEAVFCVMALQYGVLPPTANLHRPDDGSPLDLIALTAREARITTAMSNSLGFGGHNVSLIFRRGGGQD